jgi:hypothetical protein
MRRTAHLGEKLLGQPRYRSCRTGEHDAEAVEEVAAAQPARWLWHLGERDVHRERGKIGGRSHLKECIG